MVRDPRKYEGKEVTVSGAVKGVLALVVFKSFVLKDDTGEIAVITSRILPAVGQKLKVTGTVKEAFALGTGKLLVIMDKERSVLRRAKGRASSRAALKNCRGCWTDVTHPSHRSIWTFRHIECII